MNHLGPGYFSERWDRKGRDGLNAPKEKLKALLGFFDIPIADVQSDYASYILGLRIRDQLVHGRTHETSKGDGVRAQTPLTNWIGHCEPHTAKRVFDAVTALIERLGEASGEGRFCWGVFGHGTGWHNVG